MKYRNEVSHQWQRRRILRAVNAGIMPRRAVCDADFLLVTASQYHGYEVERPCPICGSENLREVHWIYGDNVGRRSGSARTLEEIGQILAEDGMGPITVHRVEVCPQCKWNHLLATGLATSDT